MKKIFLIIILLLSFTAFGETDIQLVVDGENITHLMEPVIMNDRTMVPIKFVSDAIGATVVWNGDSRTVDISTDEHTMKLWIDNRLVKYDDQYMISDVAPTIINDRTFVPIRLISNGLNVSVEWDNATRSVLVNSSEAGLFEEFYDVKMNSPQDITGKITVSAVSNVSGDYEAKLLLIDPEDAKGFVVANSGNTKTLEYNPKVSDNGKKILVFAYYDKNRKFIAGDLKLVDVQVKPSIEILESNDGKTVTIDQVLNFIPDYITYELTNMDTEKTTIISERDPFETYSYTPSFDQNGTYRLRVIAYDEKGDYYSSGYKYVDLNVSRYLKMNISDGKVISGPTTLLASRNFDVNNTKYYVIDEQVTLLKELPYGGYEWFPTAANSGEKQLKVVVEDTKGNILESDPVSVTVDGRPKLILSGVGPNQVLTDKTTLKVRSNIQLDRVEYILTKTIFGQKKTLGEGESFVYQPIKEEVGPLSLQAIGYYGDSVVKSESIEFEVFLGTLYGARPVIEKDKFLEFASGLAKESFYKTGMSASLQTAQAILETAWGQSLPVDKYTGEFSYNLFGIKGSGTNGSVISNTWEVYNGVSFRVDANFRAYNNVYEAWDDHKRILLELSRYEPYREVMYDSTLGAYAVRRCGYATDPKYPRKLIDIIERYDLMALDRVNLDLK